jgi:hypothetical protein
MTANSINPKTGLTRFPAALCYWRTMGKQWIFQSREPRLSSMLRTYKATRKYMTARTGGHLTSWAINCTAAKARSIVRSLNKELRRHTLQCIELTGREGGK